MGRGPHRASKGLTGWTLTLIKHEAAKCRSMAAAKSNVVEAEADSAHLNGVERSRRVFHHNPGGGKITCVTLHNVDLNIWPAAADFPKIFQSGKKTKILEYDEKYFNNTCTIITPKRIYILKTVPHLY